MLKLSELETKVTKLANLIAIHTIKTDMFLQHTRSSIVDSSDTIID